MVRAWKIKESELDENKWDKSVENISYLDLETVRQSTGVLYWQLDADAYKEDGSLEKIRKDRGYSYEDEIEVSSDKLPNFEMMIKKFANEHLHTDEEIRFILDGKGYFDVREGITDEWVRIEVVKGDLIILPAGIYHRLVLDPARYIKAKRLFVGEPVWTAYDRPADEMEARQKYLSEIKEANRSA
ncbi:unnamed protein product [Orchesella dallaii]|uniref:Acireductone dioxygenase n=1 Tax=Orchesella dallaii TaxID=48710 RepID=A0ABP1QC02_9HEXA